MTNLICSTRRAGVTALTLSGLGVALFSLTLPAPVRGQATVASLTTRTPSARSTTMDTLTTVDLPLRTAVPDATPADTAIRPFTFHASDEALADLRRRIVATKWPEKETTDDQSQGTPLATVQKLAAYWANGYDWRKIEKRLDALPQFITSIDGLDIHFIHVRSKHPNALPIIITHGWPGSIVEQLKLIDPLVNPTAHGGTAADAFDVVIPSMPGYGFSGKPAAGGWSPARIAKAWDVLMKRLGYTRYVAQGGDWGAFVTEELGLLAPRELAAIHVNMAAAIPPEVEKAAALNAPLPAGLSAEEAETYHQLTFFFKHVYYAYVMADRPQSLTALADSPVGLAAFLLDHDAASLAMIARSFDGIPEGLTRDDVLDNVTLFWLTNTAISAARLYRENTSGFFSVRGIKIPVAVSVYPDELYAVPRSWAEKAFPRLIHYNRLPKGGHFAAWEQPGFMVSELRASFKTVR